MPGAAGPTKGFQVVADWIGGIFTGRMVVVEGW
jgi:hypothetical protein